MARRQKTVQVRAGVWSLSLGVCVAKECGSKKDARTRALVCMGGAWGGDEERKGKVEGTRAAIALFLSPPARPQPTPAHTHAPVMSARRS